ncbi:hypothetical protein [Metabacillus fastidiosus]|uniref:hypothetical protein n=1 Tax=Metabacillus fastidiosus TaxID=1458 RepID=UPI003D2A6F30
MKIYVVQDVSGGLESNLEYVGTDKNKAFSYTPEVLEGADVEITTWEDGIQIDYVLLQSED